MRQILVTGGSGFIGTALVQRLRETGNIVTVVSRRSVDAPSNRGHVTVGAIDSRTDWRPALRDQDVLVHLAGLLPSVKAGPEDHARINAQGTARLMEQSAESGIRTAIFLSSIAVVTANANTAPVSDASPPAPASPYGRSKLAAEQHISQFASTDRAGISLRPPLVYGANAKGNWRSMLNLAASGLPLPFGAVDNRRTMICVDTLVSAILRVIETAEPRISGAYAVADRESVSLAEMMILLREGMGTRPRLLPVPAPLLAAPLRVAGKGNIADSLMGDLEVDSSRFRETFDWSPPENARDAIRRCGREYAAIRR